MSADVVVVGAGPYALSAAAHLRAASRQLELLVFGEPMAFWRRHMPGGMLLRSPWAGSHIAAPEGLTLDAYRTAKRARLSAPVPLERYVEYGLWFQQHVAPDVDRRSVARIDRTRARLAVTLEDGDRIVARRIVVAAGILPFAWRPRVFAQLPSAVVSHTSEHGDLGVFRGRRVAVIGGGQSALESAALLHESGAEPELIVREQAVHFVHQRQWLHRGVLAPLLYAPPDVGPAGVSQLVARPNAFRLLPRRAQDLLGERSVRPAGGAWLVPRLACVPLLVGGRVVRAGVVSDGTVRLELADGTRRETDHVLLATGYRVDVARYAFLPQELRARLACAGGFPKLGNGLESSVPGLHFLGAAAAWSFGPLLRFVAGTSFAGPELTRVVAARRRGRRRGARRTDLREAA